MFRSTSVIIVTILLVVLMKGVATSQTNNTTIQLGASAPVAAGQRLINYVTTAVRKANYGNSINPHAFAHVSPISGGIASGTDFHVQVHVVYGNHQPDPHGIKWMEVAVSGTLANGTPCSLQVVAHKDLPYNYSGRWQLGFRLDSTMFQSGSTIREYLTCAFWSPSYYGIPVEYDYKVVNNGYINYAPDAVEWGQEMYEYVRASAVAMGVKQTNFSQSIGTDDRAFFLLRIPYNTFFFMLAHGNGNNFGDCIQNATDHADAADVIGRNAVKMATASKVSTGLESPYPPGRNPPYNFVHLFACELAGQMIIPEGSTVPVMNSGVPSHEFANAFGMYNGVSIDKASLMWRNEMKTKSPVNLRWTERLFDYLKQGFSLRSAIKLASVDSTPMGEIAHGVENWVPVSPYIEGDPTMTVHGVWLNKKDPKRGTRGSMYYWCYDGKDTNPE
jgi:hypothetical protein